MDRPARDHLTELLEDRDPPCLSLYQPTARRHPENQQDPIRYRNLVDMLEQALRTHYPDSVDEHLAPFRALGEEHGFWNTTREGIAVFGAAGFFRVHVLDRPVEAFTNVADSFRTKPLMRILQSDDRYQILALDRQKIRLYEGNRDGLAEIEPAAGVPRTVVDALGDELTEPHQTVASYGTGAPGTAMHHGHGGKKDEVDIDVERFFRAVDRAVLEHHSRPSGAPLILAALQEYQGEFRRLTRNPHLVDNGIGVHPDALDLDALRERAWQVIGPTYGARLDGLIERFGTAAAQERGSENLDDVAEAAAVGRVATLMIEADRHLPGRVDRARGVVEPGDLSEPSVDDMLDNLGEIVLRTGGELVVVPSDRMPTQTGVAAIYRY